MFWRTGKYAPWVRQQWAEEEKIADTLFARKDRMTNSVAAVINGSIDQQQEVATQLSDVILRSPVLLLRLHALDLITSLNSPKRIETLTIASTDPSIDIRLATTKSLGRIGSQDAMFQLQEMLANDSEIDVRLAATRALGDFRDPMTVRALAIALKDRNPALQIGATESLAKVTGNREFGPDVVAWREFVNQNSGSTTAPLQTDVSNSERLADGSSNKVR